MSQKLLNHINLSKQSGSGFVVLSLEYAMALSELVSKSINLTSSCSQSLDISEGGEEVDIYLATNEAINQLDLMDVLPTNENPYLVKLDLDEGDLQGSVITKSRGDELLLADVNLMETAVRWKISEVLNAKSISSIEVNHLYKIMRGGSVDFYQITKIESGKVYGCEVKKTRLNAKNFYRISDGARGVEREIYDPFRLTLVAGNPSLS